MARQWVKRCWISLAGLMFFAAVVMSLVRLLAPMAHRYKAELESHLSLLVGEPVTIKRMHASWYWFEPVLKLDRVVVSHDGNKVLSFKELLVGINLFSSLWHWQIQPGVLFIDKVHLNLHQENQHWRVDGIPQGNYATNLTPQSYVPLLAWLLSQQKIVIKNVTATLHLQDGTLVPIEQVALMAVNKQGHYRLKAHATLGQDEKTDFSLLGDLEIPSDPFRGAMGPVFFSAKNVNLGQIRSFLPKKNYEILKGRGDLQVWLDLNRGRVKQLQSQVHVQDLVWHRETSDKKYKVHAFDANLAFSPLKKGWQLTADHIVLETPQGVWPENQALLSFDSSSQTYQVFIKTLSLASFDTLGIEWPEAFESLLKMKPKGTLDSSQIGIKEGEVSSFLSKFSSVSFDGKEDIPRVKNLSGAFYWEPTQGRLELEGENTTFVFKGQAPLRFKEINVALDWKTLSEGLRLNLDRLVINHPNLLLSARGLLDGVTKDTWGTLQLSGEFSTLQGEYWLPFLPLHDHVKPKLEAWLTKDIHRVQEATGKFRVNGPWADFPFDEKPGDFLILTSLHGV
ncbi:MAG: YhdP family protein, partial [Legionellaceae bacterium]